MTRFLLAVLTVVSVSYAQQCESFSLRDVLLSEPKMAKVRAQEEAQFFVGKDIILSLKDNKGNRQIHSFQVSQFDFSLGSYVPEFKEHLKPDMKDDWANMLVNFESSVCLAQEGGDEKLQWASHIYPTQDGEAYTFGRTFTLRMMLPPYPWNADKNQELYSYALTLKKQ